MSLVKGSQHGGLAQIIERSSSAENTDDPLQPGFGRKHILLFGLLIGLSIFTLLLSLSWSSVPIPLTQVLAVLIGGEVEKESWRTIVMDIRLPRSLTAIAVGIGLGHLSQLKKKRGKTRGKKLSGSFAKSAS